MVTLPQPGWAPFLGWGVSAVQPLRLLLSMSHGKETLVWLVEWSVCPEVADGTGSQNRDANSDDSNAPRPALHIGFQLLPTPAKLPLQTPCIEEEWRLQSQLQQHQYSRGTRWPEVGVFTRRIF